MKSMWRCKWKLLATRWSQCRPFAVRNVLSCSTKAGSFLAEWM